LSSLTHPSIHSFIYSLIQVLEALNLYRPKVYEFARLNMTYTVLSKRKLLKLVKSDRVRGWDDPRMPTIKGASPACLPLAQPFFARCLTHTR